MPTRKRFDSMSARDTGLEYLLRRLDRLEGNPGLVARDTRRTGGTGGGVDPTFLVAASDASPGMRAAADWVCTGSGDQVEIQAALNALPASGGRVQLSEGTFNIARATSATPITMYQNTELVGVGPGTLLDVSGAGTNIYAIKPEFDEGFITSIDYNIRIADMTIDVADCTGSGGAIKLIGPSLVEGCWFTGLGQAGLSGFSYVRMTHEENFTKPIVTACQFLDISNGAGITGEYGTVDSCVFQEYTIGTGGFAIDFGTNTEGSVISNCQFHGTNVRQYGGPTVIDGCLFEQCTLVLDAKYDTVITGNVFLGSASTPFARIQAASATVTQWNGVRIEGNTFRDGGIDLGGGQIRGLTIADNNFRGKCAIAYNSGANVRNVSDVMVRDNLALKSASVDTDMGVRFVGTALTLKNFTVSDNSFTADTPPTTSSSMIDIQFSGAVADNGQSVKITDNLLEFLLGTDDGYAIRVRGRTGSGYGHVVVAGNVLRASGAGVLVSAVRDVVISNNMQGITSDTSASNALHSNQLTVSGAGSAIVDGNKWISGEAADGAGTGAAIYVQAAVGAVRNNDIWGKLVGTMDTALKYSAGLVESGNVYHGLHSSQTGSMLTRSQASGSGGTASVVFTGTATGAVV